MILNLQLSAITKDIVRSGQPLSIALEMLVRAYQYATDTNVDRWEFAIPINEFRCAGVTISELRWLLFSGFAIHAKEIVEGNGQYRKYARLGIRSFPPNACFILSDQGIKAIEAITRRPINQETVPIYGLHSYSVTQNGATPKIVAKVNSIPYWDPGKLELTYQGTLVKTYRSLPTNQGAILAAFQEEKWPSRIDDPLAPVAGQYSQRRLSDAIKQLNRYQRNRTLRFRGDGTGKGVSWEALD